MKVRLHDTTRPSTSHPCFPPSPRLWGCMGTGCLHLGASIALAPGLSRASWARSSWVLSHPGFMLMREGHVKNGRSQS